MTWDLYSSNFDGYGTENRKVISTFSVISIKMIQNGGFQFCPEKWSKPFNHDLNMVTTGDPPWLENPRPGAPSTNLAFSSARSGRSWKRMDLDQGPRHCSVFDASKSGTRKGNQKKLKKNIDIIRYLDRKVWYLDLWCAVFSLAALESSEVPHDTMTPSGCLFNHDVQQLVL